MVRYLHSILLKDSHFASGPLHSVYVASQGEIFYSDEVNHVVTARDKAGKLRWNKGSKGSGPGQFIYPRGVCMGLIKDEGNPIPCIAVADSWNKRVQFLTLEGEWLSEWTCALENLPFSEPVDVRFEAFGFSAEPGDVVGCWLVLDKGHHALWIFDCNGKCLGRIGRRIGPHKVSDWIDAGEYPNLRKLDHNPAGTTDLFDFLYYPARILGTVQTGLHIWEPFTGNLKLVAFGNCIPLKAGYTEDSVCIAVDNQGSLYWNQATNCITAYDRHGQVLASERIEGFPVVSNLPANEVYIQRGSRLFRARIVNRDGPSSNDESGLESRLMYAAGARLENLEIEQFRRLMSPALLIVSDLIVLADEIINRIRAQSFAGELTVLQNRLSKATAAWEEAIESLYENLRPYYFAILPLRLCLQKEAADPVSGRALQLWNQMITFPSRAFIDLVSRCDDLLIYDYELAELENRTPNISALRQLCGNMQWTLNRVIDWIYGWSGSNHAFKSPLSASRQKPLDAIPPSLLPKDSSMILAGNRRDHKFLQFEAVDPILCQIDDSAYPTAPHYIIADKSGCLFVSLSNANRILRIDSQGGKAEFLDLENVDERGLREPKGLCFDQEGRLWIGDSLNRRLLVFNYPFRRQDLAACIGAPDLNMNFPLGMIRFGAGILLADPGQNSVFHITIEGSIKRTMPHTGADRSTVKFPASFCADIHNAEEYVWLVDRRNHRLIRVDSSYNITKTIGSFGFTPGCLRYPGALAMFHDGILVVAENSRSSGLVFLTEDGDEVGRLCLDYAPTGLLVQDEWLYVCQYNGSFVHRYKRIR